MLKRKHSKDLGGSLFGASNLTYNHCITRKKYLNMQHFEGTNYIYQTTSRETE